MNESGCSSHPTGKAKRVSTGQRRFWTHQEELALADALKILRTQGWKCDGSFKGGYMVRLESMMAEKIPGGGILVKHIKSKLQVWKKMYAAIIGILSSSGSAGATIDPVTNMIVTETDAVWDDYIKVNPDAAKVRGKPQPLYYSWVEIFGNDRAQGTGAIDVGDAVQEMIYGAKLTDMDKNADAFQFTATTTQPNSGNEMFDDAVSNTPPTLASQPPKSLGSSRRKRSDTTLNDLETIVGRLMENTTFAIGNLTEKLMQAPSKRSKHDSPSSARQALFDALIDIPGISLNDQVLVTHLLANNKADMDAFWGMSKEGRSCFVAMLLKDNRDI